MVRATIGDGERLGAMAASDGTNAVGLMDLANDASRRGVSIASESALFVALLTAEALREAPGAVDVATIRINVEGGLEPLTRRGAADEKAAIDSVARVCETLLKPPTGMARMLLERTRKDEIKTLDALQAELEALLVPLNRSAAKRVLGRFVREHQRAVTAATASKPAEAAPPAPADHEFAGLERAPESEPAPPKQEVSSKRPHASSALDTEPDAAAGITALLAHPLGPVSDDGMSHPALLNPRIPPPPPLGSLGSMPPIEPSATDTEPEGQPIEPPKKKKRAEALDTAIDADVLAKADKPLAGSKPIARRSGANVVLGIALISLVLALLVVAFAMMNRH